MKGINLAARHKDIEQIIRKKFSAPAKAAGIEVEDLVQDVFIKLMRTNCGARPNDPDRASLGTFVYLVAQSVLRNEIRRKTRAKRPRGVPVRTTEDWEEGGYVPEDLHPRE